MIGQNESLLAALLSQGLFLPAIAISRAMSLRPRSRRKPQSQTSVTAYNAALCFLARPKHCRLSDAERANQSRLRCRQPLLPAPFEAALPTREVAEAMPRAGRQIEAAYTFDRVQTSDQHRRLEAASA